MTQPQRYEKGTQGGFDVGTGRWRDKSGKFRPRDVILGLVKQPKFCVYCGMPLADSVRCKPAYICTRRSND